MKSIFTIFILYTFACFFVSCEGDCKDVDIEKVEWITTYIEKTKDTLVTYSVTENKREYLKYLEEVKHTITIQNNNAEYSGRFALKINYGYIIYDNYNYTSNSETKTKEFEYVTIDPMSSYTFTYNTQGEGYNNFNSSYTILQTPVSFTYKERKDELKTERITVNSCQENVEALKEKYKTIKELYKAKTENENNGQEK